MEPEEINEFSKQMQEGGESNLRLVSLIISILAVFVAMVTVMGHRTHTEAVLQQARASDIWNEYQAKHIRERVDTDTVALLSLQPNANQGAVETKLDFLKKNIDKSLDDQKEAQAKAREYEAEVALAERKAARYDLGEALLQIAVVLSSITLLTRQRLFVSLGLVLGLTGLVIAATALFLR